MRYARSWLVWRLTGGSSSSTCLLLCICRHLLREHLEAAAAACTTHAATVPLTDAVQLHVYCSPFSRTIETATLAAAQAGLSSNNSERFQVGACVADAVPNRAAPSGLRAAVHVQTRDALMERNFGTELEGKSYHGGVPWQ